MCRYGDEFINDTAVFEKEYCALLGATQSKANK